MIFIYIDMKSRKLFKVQIMVDRKPFQSRIIALNGKFFYGCGF